MFIPPLMIFFVMLWVWFISQILRKIDPFPPQRIKIPHPMSSDIYKVHYVLKGVFLWFLTAWVKLSILFVIVNICNPYQDLEIVNLSLPTLDWFHVPRTIIILAHVLLIYYFFLSICRRIIVNIRNQWGHRGSIRLSTFYV